MILHLLQYTGERTQNQALSQSQERRRHLTGIEGQRQLTSVMDTREHLFGVGTSRLVTRPKLPSSNQQSRQTLSHQQGRTFHLRQSPYHRLELAWFEQY